MLRYGMDVANIEMIKIILFLVDESLCQNAQMENKNGVAL
jgi:hypothetical protein